MYGLEGIVSTWSKCFYLIYWLWTRKCCQGNCNQCNYNQYDRLLWCMGLNELYLRYHVEPNVLTILVDNAKTLHPRVNSMLQHMEIAFSLLCPDGQPPSSSYFVLVMRTCDCKCQFICLLPVLLGASRNLDCNSLTQCSVCRNIWWCVLQYWITLF